MKNYDGLSNLQSLKDFKHVVGLKQTIKSLENGEAKTVYLAQDCEPRLTDKVYELASKNGVNLVMVDSKENLGKMVSLKVESAAAAILK